MVVHHGVVLESWADRCTAAPCHHLHRALGSTAPSFVACDTGFDTVSIKLVFGAVVCNV